MSTDTLLTHTASAVTHTQLLKRKRDFNDASPMERSEVLTSERSEVLTSERSEVLTSERSKVLTSERVGQCVRLISSPPGSPRNPKISQIKTGSAKHTAISYICELPSSPGKFQLDKAQALGVPRGPMFGLLQKGVSVTLKNGAVVTPDMVSVLCLRLYMYIHFFFVT